MCVGYTGEVACRSVAEDPAAAGVDTALQSSSTGHANGHGDRSPPASGEKDGHHTKIYFHPFNSGHEYSRESCSHPSH